MRDAGAGDGRRCSPCASPVLLFCLSSVLLPWLSSVVLPWLPSVLLGFPPSSCLPTVLLLPWPADEGTPTAGSCLYEGLAGGAGPARTLLLLLPSTPDDVLILVRGEGVEEGAETWEAAPSPAPAPASSAAA